MQLYSAEKVKRDIRDLLNADTNWTNKPNTIALERDEKVYQSNWLSNSDSSVLIREVDNSYSHYLGMTGGINTIVLSLDVFAEKRDIFESIINDIIRIMRNPSLDSEYVDVILRSTQQDSTSYRKAFRALLSYQIRVTYSFV